MIGPKKLSTIRSELKQALAIEGDPIEWLDRQTASREGKVTPASGANEITRSLRRLLEARQKPRKRRDKVKK